MSDLIFGRAWEEIVAMQQRQSVSRPIEPSEKPAATEADRKLLEQVGLDGLKNLKLFGVIDRLKNSNLL